jgi:hypothetical protein
MLSARISLFSRQGIRADSVASAPKIHSAQTRIALLYSACIKTGIPDEAHILRPATARSTQSGNIERSERAAGDAGREEKQTY